MKKKFWMVWCEGGGAPRYQHDSEESARTEAERLARTHGGTFHVLECKASCTRNDVDWQEHSRNSPSHLIIGDSLAGLPYDVAYRR